MLLRCIASGCAVTSLAVLVTGLIGAFGGDDLAVDVVQRKPFLDAFPLDREAEVHFLVSNRTNTTVRVVGLDGGCDEAGCVTWKSPLELAPGRQDELIIGFRPARPGDFRREVTLYLDSHGLRELSLLLAGRAVVPQESNRRLTRERSAL